MGQSYTLHTLLHIHLLGAKREKSMIRKRCLGEIAGNKTFRPKAPEVTGKEAFYAREIAGKKAFRCQAWEIACNEAFGGE